MNAPAILTRHTERRLLFAPLSVPVPRYLRENYRLTVAEVEKAELGERLARSDAEAAILAEHVRELRRLKGDADGRFARGLGARRSSAEHPIAQRKRCVCTHSYGLDSSLPR